MSGCDQRDDGEDREQGRNDDAQKRIDTDPTVSSSMQAFRRLGIDATPEATWPGAERRAGLVEL
jgi:hypothetical protein